MKFPSLPVDTTPFAWGAVAGAIVLTIVGFNWGGWVTGGTADKRVSTASREAVVGALAPICVTQFQAQGDATIKIAELAKTSSWERSSVVEKSGFAMMPGSKTTDSDVARACAEILSNPKT
ncbi:MAG: hypothetical protein HY059_14270 [Proteobacteria bacterium]|nr:hypothetical protein [Pseudomonadota bacterium]